MNIRRKALLAMAAMALGACASPPAEAPAPVAEATAPAPAAAFAPVVSLNEIMVYVVDTHANEIWDASMVPPRNDEGWKTLNRAAVALAASGSLTKVSGNAPKDQIWTQQADWINHSQALADAGLAVKKAVEEKDAAALSKAGDQLVVSCINCHREYKLDVPQIWTERQLPPEERNN